ncbi:MAG TPA: TlpA disulfide reductase family protein [Dehalococcoidia bacterium]|nr:TlpA disulfide reductase family protein [Dehalococcoidia bacterium]
MSKTWLIVVIVIIAILALGGIALNCTFSGPSGSTPQSKNATDFTLPTLTGANITLSELEGTQVVLNFWATTCQYCEKQLPYLESVARQSVGNITVIAIDVGQNASKVQDFLQSHFGTNETAMIVALDANGATFVTYCQNYGDSGGYIPLTLFADSEGVIQYERIGAFASEAELWNALHSVFGITIP